jgi:hypothetical protein
MATRAEHRGIGICGNKVASDIETVEFGATIARLMRPGNESEEFKTRTKAVGEMCRKSGGERAAVDRILDIIDGKDWIQPRENQLTGFLRSVTAPALINHSLSS